jgi:hypothetical protein
MIADRCQTKHVMNTFDDLAALCWFIELISNLVIAITSSRYMVMFIVYGLFVEYQTCTAIYITYINCSTCHIGIVC